MDILLVEDNPADIRLTEEALRLCRMPHVLRVARDGEQALAMLRQEGEHSGLPMPDLVLLDLNLPRMRGSQVLAQIKSDRRTVKIPVLILSTSVAAHDVEECYLQHANCYLQKPVNFEDFADLMRTVEEFWFTRARLPSRDKAYA